MVRRLSTQNKLKKSGKSDLHQMAARYVEARAALVRAGRVLHDQVGSSLSAAGVQLQLLRMDMPAAEARIDEALGTLEEGLNSVRELSQELCPSPAYRGWLKQALVRLAEQHNSGRCHIDVKYSATAVVPVEITAAIYDAACAAVEQALLKGAARVSVTVRGTGPLALRIADDGRRAGRVRALSTIRILAREQGLAFECSTGKGTIVSIRYAGRRPSSR